MTASSAEQHPARAAALRHALDMLRWCVTGRPRKGVLGYAAIERRGLARYAARWRALPGALAGLWRPASNPAADEWVLSQESGGWALRRPQESGPPAYFTADVPAGDQNAAFDWAQEVTPDADQRAIHYAGRAPN